MKVIDLLNTYGVDEVVKDYHLKMREYPEQGIMVLNYDMIESPKWSEITRECRSLIVTNEAPFKVVSRSFYRFFNYLECPRTDEMDFETAVVWEKIDGSIINVYFHDGEWKCSTRSMANAEGETVSGHVFKDIIDGLLHLPAFDAFGLSARDKTFIFELVSPKSRVVKPYPRDAVYLLAVIDKFTGIEYGLDELNRTASDLGVMLPEYAFLKSYNDVQALIDKCETFDEGFVIANYADPARVHRIKMKNPSHLAIAHLRDNGAISPKRIALLVWENDYDEYLGYFPEDHEFFDPFIAAYGEMLKEIDQLWEANKDIEDQKEFALAVSKTPVGKIMFMKRKGITMEDIEKKLFVSTKLTILQRYMKN